MKEKTLRVLVVFCTALLILSTLVVAAGAFETSEGSEKEIVKVRMIDGSDISELNRLDLEILERYESFLLVKTDGETIEQIENSGMDVNELPKRTQMTVKGHTFDIDEGPDLSSDLTIDGYEEGTEGLHVIHMLGPVHPEWRKTLEEKGVKIINSVPNHGYEVSMTPEKADEVGSLDFVDWVGIYQPEFKLHSRLDEALQKDMSVNIRLRPGFETSSLKQIESEFEVHGFEDLRADGVRLVVDVDNMGQLEDVAMMNDVYFISPYVEPELHGEMDSQLIGGGCWFMDDEYDHSGGDQREGDPDQPYRKHGDHGAYINQIGYTGEGVTITLADTGMGDGTTPSAGHPDLTERVVGGYSFTGTEDDWGDGHGHGTHTTGSAAADGYGGTGETFDFADYYKAQGLAYDSELFATRIFDSGGSFAPSEYYPIAEEPAQRSDAYIHSNSWGAGTEGAYSDSDEVFDQAARDADRDASGNQPMVFTFSAGNDGNRGDQTIGSPGNSKNVITVGATQTYNPPDGFENAENMADFSSRGWTEDNRVKPDVVAPGENIYSLTPEGGYTTMGGTSMSCPAVAGASGAVVEWYEQNEGETPSPAMVKSILINSAKDLDTEVGNTRGHIPNKDEGWGMVDLSILEYPTDNPLGVVTKDQETLLETGDVEEHVVAARDDNKPLNITLTWTDKNAQSGDSSGGTPTLKNNLDLEVEAPSGEVIRGNAFDVSGDGKSDDGYTYPDAEVIADFDHNDDGWDNVNNVENVFIPADQVELGAYRVRVHGTEIPADCNNDGDPNQDYALTAHNAAEGAAIEVTRPTGGRYREYWEAGTDEEIKWDTTEGIGNITDVDLEYSVDGGASWSYIAEGIDDTGSYMWTVPDEPTEKAKIRATVHDDHPDTPPGKYITDKFTITDVTPPEITLTSPVGGEEWHAGDEENITWNTVEGDEPIKRVGIEYSVDGGSNWRVLEDDLEDTGVYTWRVPDETTSEAVVQVWVQCEAFTRGTDRGDEFEMVGYPPRPPQDVKVEHDNGNNTVKWTKSPGDMINFESNGEIEQNQQENADNDVELKSERADQNKVGKIDGPVPESLYEAEKPGSRESVQEPMGDELLADRYYAFEVYPEDRSLWFPPDDPTNLNVIAPNEADDFIAGGAWVIDTWYGSSYAGGLWTIDETDGSMNKVGDLGLTLNGITYDDSTDTLYGAGGGSLYAVNPDTADTTEIGSFGIEDTMIGIAADGFGNIYGTTVSSGNDDLYSIDPNTGEATSIGDTGVSFYYAQDMAYDKNQRALYQTAYLESGTSGFYELDTDTGAATHIADFPNGEEIAGFAIPYVLNGPFFTVEIENYTQDPGTGDDVVVDYNVTNSGTEGDTQDINFTVNGVVKDSIEVNLGEGDSHEGEFIWDTSGKAGSYQVGVESDNASDEVAIMVGDTKEVSHYNIYRSENRSTPLADPMAQIDAEGQVNYEAVDAGAAGPPYHWYLVRAVAEDGVEEQNENWVREPGGPDVNTTSPAEGAIITETEVTFEWEGSGDIGNYEVQLNNRDRVDVGMDTQYTFENVPEGANQAYVFAHHASSSEVGYDGVQFLADLTPPDSEILYPEDGGYVNETKVTAEWKTYDDVTGIDHYSARLDDGNWNDIGGNTSWTPAEFEHGETHTIEVKAIDRAGLETVMSTTFTVDNRSSSPEVLWPDIGWAPSNLTAEWECEDEVSGIDKYIVRMDDGEWIDVGESTEYDFNRLDVVYPQNHTLQVEAWDRAGNHNITSVSFNIDPESPLHEIVYPSEEDDAFDSENVTVAWSTVDVHSGVSQIEVMLEGGDEWIDVGLSNRHTFEGLEDGEYTAMVRATDNVYHESLDEVTFSVDTQSAVPPQFSIVSPDRGAVHDQSEVTVEWEQGDDSGEIDSYEVMIDGGNWNDVGTGTQHTFENLGEGDHVVDVRAINEEAGLTSTKSVRFTVDTESPEITILSPDNDELFETNEVTLLWQSSDTSTGIDYHEVRVNEDEWIDVGSSQSHTLEGLEDGNHTVEVRATDEVGHTQEAEISFTVDTTAPELEINSPESGALFSENIVTLDWDGTGDVEEYSLRINQGEWEQVDTATEHTFEGLSDGEHLVEVMAEDEAGHTTTKSLSFTVDTTAPDLFITSPNEEQTLEEKELTIKWGSSDKLSGLGNYEVRLDDGEWIDMGTDTQYTFEDLSEDDHTVEVRAEDNAGNVVTEDITFTIQEEEEEGGLAGTGGMSFLWILVIILVILVIILAVMLMRKGGEEEEEVEREPGAAPPADQQTEDYGWDEEEELYGEPAEEQGPPPAEEQPEQPPESEEVPEQEEEVFEESQPNGEEAPPPPPESSESSEDLLEDLEEEEG
ncbi:MAG: S8 family serine peptidase [Candidatus Thermoplasmatota archaeon]